MNIQNKVILFAVAGIIAGFGIGYVLGTHKKEPRFLYEWEEEEDYGDEDDNYELGATVIQSELDDDDWFDGDNVTMKAEPQSIK
jgi:hypothetical protein